MKKIFIYLGISSFVALASCSEEVQQKSDLQTLIAKKDSLQTQADALTKQIKDLELKIDDLDSTKRLYIVDYVLAEDKKFEHFVEVQGNVNSDQSISIFPETQANVEKILVKEGDKVKKDQVLVRFDSKILRNNRKELKANLDLAETTYNKQKKLWKQNIGSEIEYLKAKTNVESLRSKLAALDSQIKMSEIIAPFSGVVDEIFLKEGEMASPMSPGVRLINMDNVYIESQVSERYLGNISKGTKALVSFSNLDAEVESKVEMTGNYISPANRSFRVVINVPNEDHKIKPNQLAVVDLNDFSADGIVVPKRVILNSPQGDSYVYILEGNGQTSNVKKVNVKVGPNYKGNILVLEGLKKGDKVVDKGSRSIQDNQKVRVKA